MKHGWLVVIVAVGLLVMALVWYRDSKTGGHTKVARPVTRMRQSKDTSTSHQNNGPYSSQVPINRKLTPNQAKAMLIELREKAAADPHNAMRWIEIAKLYNNIGNYYRACQYLKKSLEMDPKFQARPAVEEIIEQCDRKFQGNPDH